MRISDWSSDVCSSDLGCHDQYARQHDRIQQTRCAERAGNEQQRIAGQKWQHHQTGFAKNNKKQHQVNPFAILRYPVAKELVYMENHVKQIKHIHYRKKLRSEEQTSELQSLMRTSYTVFCLNKKH